MRGGTGYAAGPRGRGYAGEYRGFSMDYDRGFRPRGRYDGGYRR